MSAPAIAASWKRTGNGRGLAALLLLAALAAPACAQAMRPSAEGWQQQYRRGASDLTARDWSRAAGIFSALRRSGHSLPGPARAAVAAGLGEAEFHLHHTTAAERDLRASLRLDPSHPAVHLLLASLLQQQGHTGAALRQFRDAVRLDPGNRSTRLAFARACGQAGRHQQEAEELLRLLRQTPRDPELHFELGRAFSALTTAAYRNLAAAGVGTARLAQARGETWAGEGQWALAAAQFQLAIRRDPHLTTPRLDLARVRLTQHQPANALRILAKILAKIPGNPEAVQLRREAQRQQEADHHGN